MLCLAVLSLLGLFNVSLPLLYGEGSKAFLRLQIEIIRKSDDESIFVWWTPNAQWNGLLAPNPSAFNAERLEKYVFKDRRHFEMTNKGLRFTVHIPDCYIPLDPHAFMTILFPLNVVRTIQDKEPRDGFSIQRAAIRILALRKGDRILKAHRFTGDSREVGIIFAHKGHRLYDMDFIYDDEHGEMLSSGKRGSFLLDAPMHALIQAQDSGGEWQIYFSQDGM